MEFVLIIVIWLTGMMLICALGTCLKDIEREERNYRMNRISHPTAFMTAVWNNIRDPQARADASQNWYNDEAKKRKQWEAGQSSRDRKKWALRIAMLVVVVVALWILIVTG